MKTRTNQSKINLLEQMKKEEKMNKKKRIKTNIKLSPISRHKIINAGSLQFPPMRRMSSRLNKWTNKCRIIFILIKLKYSLFHISFYLYMVNIYRM